MMFHCSSKITDRRVLCCAAVLSLVLQLCSCAETTVQTLSIEKSPEIQETCGAESVIETIINHTEPPVQAETAPAREIVIKQSAFSNPYYPYKETVIITAPAYNTGFDAGGYSYRGYNFTGHGYDYTGHSFTYNTGSLYYGADGKRYYKTPWMPVNQNPPPPPPPPNGSTPPPPPPQHGHHHDRGHGGIHASFRF